MRGTRALRWPLSQRMFLAKCIWGESLQAVALVARGREGRGERGAAEAEGWGREREGGGDGEGAAWNLVGMSGGELLRTATASRNLGAM